MVARAPGRRAVLVLAAFLIAAASLSAQDATAGSQDEVFAPFVSRLRLSIHDPQVRITWDDAADLTTSYEIYRAAELITNQTFSAATLVATVGPGEEAYIDIPPEPGSWYYAVVALNSDGDPYQVLIPGRNSSYRPVDIANVATEEQRAAAITGLTATVVQAEGQSGVQVTGTADRDNRTVAIYRSTDPITSVDDIANAALVKEVPSASVELIDLPVPGVPYYYAAVDTGLLIAGGATVTPGANATAGPVEIPLPRTASVASASQPGTAAPTTGTATQPSTPAQTTTASSEPDFELPPTTAPRGIPLPYLRLQNQLANGHSLSDPRISIPSESQISDRTQGAVDTLLAGLSERPARSASPEILTPDTIPDPQGAEYTLRTILDGPFARMAWESAIDQLDNYLTLPLPSQLAARAHFYRAQAYYFLGNEQTAVLEFLLARDAYYVDVESWLDVILG